MKPREPRKRVATPARMRTDAGWSDVTIRDISSRGLGLRSTRAPRRGDVIELCRHQHRLIGRVMWSSGESFGVVLSDIILVEELLSGNAPARRVANERRGRLRQSRSLRPRGDSQVALVSLAENSRHLARLMNFAAVAAIACIAASLAALLASSVLSKATSAVSAGLLTNKVEASAG